MNEPDDVVEWFRAIRREVTHRDHPRISQDPKVMVGKPVINGTRIPVELILRKLGAGWSIETLLEGYPRLTREDILAAQAFAADYMARENLKAAEAEQARQ